MKIPKDDFYQFEFPNPFTNLWHGWGFIGKHFCIPTTQRGMCDQETGGDCSRCEKYIRPVFTESTKPHVKKPWGFVTYHLRTASAKFADEKKVREEPTTEWNEREVREDPFGAVADDLNDPRYDDYMTWEDHGV